MTSTGVFAQATPEEITQLNGERLTCTGAERAASASGVAAYAGQWIGSWPGLKNARGYDPGPYAAEKPLFTINAGNMQQYADRLTDGQKVLLKKFPDSFRMNIYPSHRDFGYPDWVCGVVKKNAATAQLNPDGNGVQQVLGGIPFPFPRNGLEALFNIKRGAGMWSESAVHSSANVYANGTIAWGKVRLKVLVPWNKPDLNPRPLSKDERIEAYFYHEQILPPRDKGIISVGATPTDYGKDRLVAWFYSPGTRRVRQAEDVGPDYPVPPAGLHTVDDEALFNGSPERFTWKLIGKKEIYVPYHNFRINDPSIRYADLLKPHTINPDYERYELHRVWVVEGTLKQGLRHVYGRRVLYADEDTWHPLWSDNYDTRGVFWRANFTNYFYAPAARSFHRGVTIYHDLIKDAYEAEYLVNESGDGWWSFNDPSFTPAMFAPNVLARQGH